MIIYTIGHSHTTIARFLELLRCHQIATLIDIRSQPYSRFAPHFSRKSLRASLREAGIAYVYLGDALGGRPSGEQYRLPDGSIDYTRLATAPVFLAGLEQLQQAATTARVAIMCAEADYRKCHRYWLVTRALISRGVAVGHILHTAELAHTPPDAFPVAPRQLELFQGERPRHRPEDLHRDIPDHGLQGAARVGD